MYTRHNICFRVLDVVVSFYSCSFSLPRLFFSSAFDLLAVHVKRSSTITMEGTICYPFFPGRDERALRMGEIGISALVRGLLYARWDLHKALKGIRIEDDEEGDMPNCKVCKVHVPMGVW